MQVDRRDWLKLGAVAGAGVWLTAASAITRRFNAPELPSALSVPEGPLQPLARLLNRAGFGGAPGDLARIARLGPEAWVEEQLRASLEEPKTLTARTHGLPIHRSYAAELYDEPREEIVRQLQLAAILQAVYSRNQLRERLVDFWTNHFNISVLKGDGAFYKPADELRVIRKHALGRFPAMVRASAHSPAMLMYLDNQVNRRGTANENYARELLELHTLGVRGGYTQKDVQEVARCFTGWTIHEHFLGPVGEFRFEPALHDNTPKHVLGHDIPPVRDPRQPIRFEGEEIPAGQLAGERVIEIVTQHPATARHIAGKLCRLFLGDAAPALEESVARIYLQTQGDIAAMVRPILLSEELRSSPPILRRPFDFLVAALRALGADTDGDLPIQEHLARMGQPLYQWPRPDGYPDRPSAWTGSLLARWNFALALATNQIRGTTVDVAALMRAAGGSSDEQCAAALVEHVAAMRSDEPQARELRAAVLKHLQAAPRHDPNAPPALAEAAALVLSSPAFQWK